jgi:hypothetical protein
MPSSPPAAAAAAGTLGAGDDRLERILSILERDQHQHVLAPCAEEDLLSLESVVGYRLPSAYRQLVTRLGGGLYYDRHEIFGARRLMMHDIELVPQALSVQTRQTALRGGSPTPFLLPFHRTRDAIHWLDLRTGTVHGGGRRYPDLANFLEEVVMPAAAPDAA